jgi:hypothetical protein
MTIVLTRYAILCSYFHDANKETRTRRIYRPSIYALKKNRISVEKRGPGA